jgi:hypothetical protein
MGRSEARLLCEEVRERDPGGNLEDEDAGRTIEELEKTDEGPGAAASVAGSTTHHP